MGLAQSLGYRPDLNAEKRDKQFILMTYRSGIVAVQPKTYYSSDSGWGCMLRVGQMFIANLLFLKQKAGSRKAIVQLFYDNLMVPFSIQNMTKIAKQLYPHMKPYQWFTPCSVGFVIKQMLQKFDFRYKVIICNDGSMFLQDIKAQNQQLSALRKQEQFKRQEQAKTKQQIRNNKCQTHDYQERIVVLIMARIGLDHAEPGYLRCMARFMQNQYFMAILGGTPKYAHLFLQYELGFLGYLDPHTTNPVVPEYQNIGQHMAQYTSKLSWLKQARVDTSMSIGFHFLKSQTDKFWQSMVDLKQQLKQDFFVYIDLEKPQFDENAIIQIRGSDQQYEGEL